MLFVSTPIIVPAWAASSTCGTCASIGLVKSCTISVIPCPFAQHRLSNAPVCVLQVFSATPVHPNERPSRTSRQSWALSSINSGLRADTLCTSIRCSSSS